MANERITEDIVREHFKNDRFFQEKKIYVEEQKSSNPRINKLLKNASKSGEGAGYPEFIVSFSSPNSDLLIISECKADTKKHESKTYDKYKDFAVDGVLLYSSFLSKEYDVLSIAVSGQTKKQLKVSTFLQVKNRSSKKLAPKELLPVNDYLKLYLYDETKEKQSFNVLLEYSRKLNEYLREIDLAESFRPLVVSGILIALENRAFSKSYKSEIRPGDLAKNLVDTIIKVLDQSNIQGIKKANMTQSYGFIKIHSLLADNAKKDGGYNTILRDLISAINDNVKSFSRTYKYYDVLGKFYAEFLRYANGDKGLGIVLTPHHVTELFVEIANINERSVVLDNCCGTGGFLISAMKKMIQLCKNNTEEEKRVYKERLIGIESNSNMFTLACSNMMIRGDGKANIYYGSCFDKANSIKKHKANIGFMNPPYAKKTEKGKELNFILNNLECLEVNAICIAIVPISCAIDDPLKEKLLDCHTLEAVMSMPEDLFHDSDAGTVTCIMVFRAHVPHNQSNKKTWFGYWRNDGFVKRKKKGRVDHKNTWSGIKSRWLDAYRNRETVKKLCLTRKVSHQDEWCAEAYMQTDYSELKENEFKKIIKKYLVFNLLTEQGKENGAEV